MHRGNVLAGTAAPYFFLSYAHTSRSDARDSVDPDIWVTQLFRDLCAHIMQLADLPLSANAGFMDRDRGESNDWPMGLARALATCRVFVPLYSKRYFADERCGREWFYFARRALNRAARVSGPVEAIVPALWIPVEQRRLPVVAQAVQLSHGGSEAYESLGFYGIMKLSRYRSDYEEAVYKLARQIVTVAGRSPVKDGLPAEYDMLDNAFGVVPREVAGNRVLRITVIAPQRGELPDGREDVSYYGRSARDWSPYAPLSDRPIVDYAVKLARPFGFETEVGDLCQHEAHLLSRNPPSGPQILIIDPWALLLPRYQHLLQRLDAQNPPWMQAVILLSDSDVESQDHAGKLRATLDAVFRRKLTETASISVSAERGVGSLEQFGLVLPQLIHAAARRYLRHASAFPPDGPAVERPRVVGLVPDVG